MQCTPNISAGQLGQRYRQKREVARISSTFFLSHTRILIRADKLLCVFSSHDIFGRRSKSFLERVLNLERARCNSRRLNFQLYFHNTSIYFCVPTFTALPFHRLITMGSYSKLENKGPQVLGIFCTGTAVAAILVGLRLWVRNKIIRKVGLDDWIVTVSLVKSHLLLFRTSRCEAGKGRRRIEESA